MKKTLLSIVFGLTFLCRASGPTTPVSLVFVWTPPPTNTLTTNLFFKLYTTTNLSLPMSNWTAMVLTNVVPYGNNQLASTNYFLYGNWYFVMTWSNAMWKSESPFSNVAAPDQLPPITQQFNLNLQPTP
jgi:hypothetical protein